MRKWRPSHRSLYVVPKIHGALHSLEIILKRILPLRFSIGQEDSLVFLGDFIDKGPESAAVIDKLIEIKNENNILFIKGDHEEMLLKSFNNNANYKNWLMQGGVATLISYLSRAGLATDFPFDFPCSRLQDIIPQKHVEFLKSLPTRIDYEDYSFVHAGFNHLSSLDETSDNSLLFDDSLGKLIKNMIRRGSPIKIEAKNVVVVAENPGSKSPCIHPRYMMLDAGAPDRLIVFDLNEMVCGMVKSGKSRIYNHSYQLLEK